MHDGFHAFGNHEEPAALTVDVQVGNGLHGSFLQQNGIHLQVERKDAIFPRRQADGKVHRLPRQAQGYLLSFACRHIQVILKIVYEQEATVSLYPNAKT